MKFSASVIAALAATPLVAAAPAPYTHLSKKYVDPKGDFTSNAKRQIPGLDALTGAGKFSFPFYIPPSTYTLSPNLQ